jgi:VanZ like family
MVGLGRGAAHMATTARRTAAAIALGYLGVLALAVFWPSADYATGSVDVVWRLLHRVGAPGWVTFGAVEFTANIVLFMPLSALGSVLLERWDWWFWTGLGAVTSAAIELTQLVFLDARSATVLDVVANTLGALAGAVLASCVRSRRRAA